MSTYISTSQYAAGTLAYHRWEHFNSNGWWRLTDVLGEVYPTLIIDELQSILDADRKNKTRQLPRCSIQFSPCYIVPRTAERCLQPGVSSRCDKCLQQPTGEENWGEGCETGWYDLNNSYLYLYILSTKKSRTPRAHINFDATNKTSLCIQSS